MYKKIGAFLLAICMAGTAEGAGVYEVCSDCKLKTVADVVRFFNTTSEVGAWVLFRRGEDFTASAPNKLLISNRAISDSEHPFLIDAYGTGARPKINALQITQGVSFGVINNLNVKANDNKTHLIQIYGAHDIWMDGLVVDANGYSGPDGDIKAAVRLLPLPGLDEYNITITRMTINAADGGGRLRGIQASPYVPAKSNTIHDIIVEDAAIYDPMNLGIQCGAGLDSGRDMIWGCVYRRVKVYNPRTEKGLGCQGLIAGWLGRDILIEDSYVEGSERWGILVDSGARDVKIRNCTLVNNAYQMGSEGIPAYGPSDNIEMTGNMLIAGPRTVAGGLTFWAAAGGDRYRIFHNVVIGAMDGRGWGKYFLETRNGLTGLQSDCNVFYNTSGEEPSFNIEGKAYTDLAAYAAGTGNDVKSRRDYPLPGSPEATRLAGGDNDIDGAIPCSSIDQDFRMDWGQRISIGGWQERATILMQHGRSQDF